MKNSKYYFGYEFIESGIETIFYPSEKLFAIYIEFILEIHHLCETRNGEYFSLKNEDFGGPIKINKIEFVSNDLNKIKKYLILK